MEEGKKDLLSDIISNASKVITNPWAFYREMPKTGGYQDPVIFIAAMMIVAMIINAIGTILRIGISPMGFGTGIGAALAGIIIGPIIGVVISFVGAAILFIIWKLIGSQENYETAYRCAAYSGGIIPLTSIIGFIPYAGAPIGILWGFYLIIVASIAVHQIKPSTAWAVWGIIAAILILISITGQFAARKFANEMAEKSKEMEKAAKEMQESAKKMQESFSNMPQGGQMTEEQKKQMEETAKQMQEMMKNMPQKQEKE